MNPTGGGHHRHWTAVRSALLAVAVAAAAAAVALHPSLAARYLSDDGALAATSVRALYIAQAVLLLTAAGALTLWRRWSVPTPRRVRIALGSGAILVSLVLSALGAELGLSVVHRFVKPLGAERHYFFQYDPVLGWKHRPGSRATFKNALVNIDADGLRVSALRRGPFQSQVLLLGDSQAFGDGVAAQDTFAERLEHDMPGLRVLNASVIGYGTDQQLLYFERDGRRYAPEVTVVALNAYDLRDNLSASVRSGYAKPRFVTTPAGLTLTNVPVPGNGLADRLHRALQHRSHLYRLLTRTGRRDRQSLEEESSPGDRLALEIYPDDAHVERGLTVTASILDRLTRSVEQAGSRLIVLFLPYQMDVAGRTTYGVHTDRVVKFLQERAAADRFTFVDGRRALDTDRPERLFLDAMHLSPEGHRRVAGLLEEVLAADIGVLRTHAQ